jgi:hypothetical protein
MEATKLISFTKDDTLIAVELKVKIEDEQLYVKDEVEGWVPVHVSMMVKDKLMELS